MGQCCSNDSTSKELRNDQNSSFTEVSKREQITIHQNKANTNEQSPPPNQSTMRFTSLIKRDEDLNFLATDLESFLLSKEISNNEKLRKILLILREKTEPEEGTFKNKSSIEEFRTVFVGLIERNYRKLLEAFQKQSYKPSIKLLQIFEIMLENFKEKGHIAEKDALIKKFEAFTSKSLLITDLDWRIARKIYDLSDILKIKNPQIEKKLLEGFLKRVEKTRRALSWKSGKKCYILAESIIDSLYNLNKQDNKKFLSCLKMGRFDKKDLVNDSKINTSVVIGDEGGIYALINSAAPNSNEEAIILEAGVSEEFLISKRNEQTHKVILGEGAFGKVRLAITVLGDTHTDMGKLVCVKKSLSLGERKTKTQNVLSAVTDSTFEDFFARKLNDSVHAPKVLDMAIITNKNNNEKHRKGYLMMEIVPENTADKIFREEKFQKWEFQKPFIIEVMNTMKNLLLNNGVFNSDLKPPNTLFDPLSRKIAIIDLGSSIFIDKKANLEKFDASAGGFGVSQPYCPPEIEDEKQIECLNLFKCISYLSGVTIAEVVSQIPQEKKEKNCLEKWVLGANTDLLEAQKKILISVIEGMLDKNPGDRLDIDVALTKIKSIGSDDYIKKAIQEQYIIKARECVEKDPVILHLNSNINNTRTKGIIEQYVVPNNPAKLKNQRTVKLKEEFAKFFASNDNLAFLLLGEAGSGKSLSLQMMYLDELFAWKYGENALPIFFNLADEEDLDRVFQRINFEIGCNLKIDSKGDAIHLFIDSYDERSSGDKNKSDEKISRVQSYLNKLRTWKTIKIIISCRTAYIESGGMETLAEFDIAEANGKETVVARYVAPVDYGFEEKDKLANNQKLITEWLKRENVEGNVTKIIEKMKKLGLLERIDTPLMFNMIMKMMIANNTEVGRDFNYKLRGYEIYKRTIMEQFENSWQNKILASEEKEKKKENEKIKLIIEELKFIKGNETEERPPTTKKAIEGNPDSKTQSVEKELIRIGLERIGEMMASEMMVRKRNRLDFHNLELLFGKKIDADEDEVVKTDWKTLYHILMMMGLKLETKKSSVLVDMEQVEKEDLTIGFSHETFKNYYLLRGMKRIFANNFLKGEILSQDDWWGKKRRLKKVNQTEDQLDSLDKKIIAAILDQEENLKNLVLLKFFGEEVNYGRDRIIATGLRDVLEQEKGKAPKLTNSKDQFEENSRDVRAALAISLLVAGNYPFCYEDISDLNLNRANLRNGYFYGSNFSRTSLKQANLSYANLTLAKFIDSDLREAEIGINPDIKNLSNIQNVCFSPDGKLFFIQNFYNLLIYDSITLKELKSIQNHIGKGILFTSDGKQLITSHNSKNYDKDIGSLLIVDCETFNTDTIDLKCRIHALALSTDLIACCVENYSVQIWNWRTRNCEHVINDERLKLLGRVDFSPDGTLLAIASLQINFFDVAKKEITKTFCPVKGWQIYNLLKFKKDSKFLLIIINSTDGSSKHPFFIIWDLEKDQLKMKIEIHNDEVNNICFSNDEKQFASCSSDNSVKLWDFATGNCLQIFQGHLDKVLGLCFSLDNRTLISGGNDGRVKFWSLKDSGASVQTLETHTNAIDRLSISPDGKTLATYQSKIIYIWDLRSGENLQKFDPEKYDIYHINFSLDGRFLGFTTLDKLKLIDTKEWVVLKEIPLKVYNFVFSPDGKTCAASFLEDKILIVNHETGETIQTYKLSSSNRILNMCFSPDGKLLAYSHGMTYADKTNIKILDVETEKVLMDYSVNSATGNGRHKGLAFSVDGKQLFSTDYNKLISIWDLTDAKLLKKIQITNDNYECLDLCLSNDGKFFASSNTSGIISIGDPQVGVKTHELVEHKSSVNSIAFSPDSKLLVSCSNDKSIRIALKNEESGKFLPSIKINNEEAFECKKSNFENCQLDENLKIIILDQEGTIS